MKKHAILTIFLLMMAVVACKKQNDEPVPTTTMNSAYYWTTVFDLSQEKKEFIREHQIERLYLRFFDVVPGPEGQPYPNATVKFNDTIPDTLQIVPTVYVMNECICGNIDELANNIVTRVMKMCDTHQVPNVKEIQIDCDWTKTTQKQYFDFLAVVKKKLKDRNVGLSATIRLHQLAYEPPPVDRGVLMVYNTGDLTDPDCRNPILDPADVEPYLKCLKSYKLKIVAAYPVFSWDLLFRGPHFRGIWHYEGEFDPLPGDTLVHVQPLAKDIRAVKERIGEISPETNAEVILYDLSDANIQSIGFPF